MKILKSKDIKKLRDKKLEKSNVDPITGIIIVNPTLDHDHITGYCRGVLDRDSNQFLGKVESAYKRFLRFKGVKLENVLDGVILYLQENLSSLEIIHPQSTSLMIRRFSRLNGKIQEQVLKAIGAATKEIANCSTKNERTKLYKKYLLNPKNIYKV